MKRVLVIVVTYNGMRWLERCLGSVCTKSAVMGPNDGPMTAKKAQNAVMGPDCGPMTAVQADLYVWDNDSTDGSADFVEKNYPKAKLIRSADNLGFSVPNNRGMQYALDKGYDYVYLLNQDAWLEPGTLEKLVAAAEACPEYGVLSPLQMTDGYQQFDKQFEKILRFAQNDKKEPPYEPVEAKYIMAAHWLVPTGAIRKIGLFDEVLFPHWGQDFNWCDRLHFCGLKVGVIKEARAVHDRAYRKEEKETLVKRNYYTGALLRLANPGRPLWLMQLYVLLLTAVKILKYRSLLPIKYFRLLREQKEPVKASRAQAHSAR